MLFWSPEDDLFADLSVTEFLAVTIWTELTVRESIQLLNDLTFGDIMGGDVGVDLCVDDGRGAS